MQNLDIDDLYIAARRFFGFGGTMESIKIVFPSVDRKRKSTLKCLNYPLFDFEMSPDDLVSGLRVYSLLTKSYGESVEYTFDKMLLHEPINCHRIYIGGPPTNHFTFKAVSNSVIFFGTDQVERTINVKNNGYERPYNIGFTKNKKSRSINKDYCLISKRTTNNRIEFVIAGLRAYGQMAAYIFLSDMDFYKQVHDVSRGNNFQVLIEIGVEGRVVSNWKIVEKFGDTPKKVFISYAHPNINKAEQLAGDLRNEGFDVWFSKMSLPPGVRWKFEVEKAINASDFFIALLSKKALDSRGYLHKEIEQALDVLAQFPQEQIYFIPARLEECAISHPRLQNIQRVDLYPDCNWNVAVKSIVESLRSR